jgi:hypothetical protein
MASAFTTFAVFANSRDQHEGAILGLRDTSVSRGLVEALGSVFGATRRREGRMERMHACQSK